MYAGTACSNGAAVCQIEQTMFWDIGGPAVPSMVSGGLEIVYSNGDDQFCQKGDAHMRRTSTLHLKCGPSLFPGYPLGPQFHYNFAYI